MGARPQKPTLLFDASVKPLVLQHNFLRSPSYVTNKIRHVVIMAQCFANDSVQCTLAEGDAEIVSTALDASNPVLVVVTGADILLVQVNHASCIYAAVCTWNEVWLPVSTFLISWRISELLIPTCCPTMLYLSVTWCQCSSARARRPCCIK